MGSVGSSFIECENEFIGVASAATTAILLTLTLSPLPDEVELKWKVRVRLNPMNLETSKHSSVGVHPTGGLPVVNDGGPPVRVVWSIFVELKTGGLLVSL